MTATTINHVDQVEAFDEVDTADPGLAYKPSFKERALDLWGRMDKRSKYVIGGASLILILMVTAAFFSSGSTTAATTAVTPDFNFIAANTEYLQKSEEFHQAVNRKFGIQQTINESMLQKIESISKIDPKFVEQLKKDLDELKALQLSGSAKISELEQKQESIMSRVASAFNPIGSAHAATAPVPPEQQTQTQVAPAPAPVSTQVTVIEKPQTKRWLWAVAQCKRLDSLPIADQNTLAQKLEKSTEQGAIDWIKDCMDPSGAWRQFAYYGVDTTPKKVAVPEEQTAYYYQRPYAPVQPAPMYEGDRKLLRLNSLGPRGDVITDRPAPAASIPCIVKGVRGRCVPK